MNVINTHRIRDLLPIIMNSQPFSAKTNEIKRYADTMSYGYSG